MKQVFLAGVLFAAASAANAQVPYLDAACPKGVKVHADQGGAVTIGGKKAETREVDDNTYEASLNGVTVVVTVNADGALAVTYAGKDRKAVACRVDEQDD